MDVMHGSDNASDFNNNNNNLNNLNNTGMIPIKPTYTSYRPAPQGDGGFGSLNDALRSPTVYNTVANGFPSSRDVKSKRRESAMLGPGQQGGGGGSGGVTGNGGPAFVQKKGSMTALREER